MGKNRERSPERRHRHYHSRQSRSPREWEDDHKPSLRQMKEYARREMEHTSRYERDNRDNRGGDRHRDKRRFKETRDQIVRERSRSSEISRGNRREKQQKPHQERNPSPNKNVEEKSPTPPEIRPNFELTGALARDTNTVNGVVVKYNEPAEAKKPLKKWRLYPFKNDKPLEHIEVHRQSAYLFGRDRKVADIPIDHPSCSKQHAVLQFRSVEIERSDGTKKKRTKPYIIDLESANKTFVNKAPIEPRRYVELLEKDVIQFGFSTREYVLLHESSNDDEHEEVE